MSTATMSEMARIINRPRQTMPMTGRVLNEKYRVITGRGSEGAVIRITDERGPAPAWYNTITGDITISWEKFDGIDDIKMAQAVRRVIPGADSEDKTKMAVLARTLVGTVVHEAAHAKWSPWLHSLADRRATAAQFSVLQTLEELRIEKRAIDYYSCTRPALRSSFQIILDALEDTELTSKLAVAHLWALTVGRAYATVCELDEVRKIDDVVRMILSDEAVEDLHDLMGEAIELDARDNVDRMLEITDEWLAVVDEPHDESDLPMLALIEATDDEGVVIPTFEDGDDGERDPDAERNERGGPGYGDGGVDDDDGEYTRVTDEESKLLADAINEVVEDIIETATWRDVRLGSQRLFAKRVFGKKKIADGKNWKRRPPNAHERQAATALTRHLESITYVAPSITTKPSLVPPGRLSTRHAVTGAAERSRGAMITAKPWQTKRRTHVHNPPLTLALMTDTSGSMSWAQEAVSSCAYVFANAVSRIGGRFAAVTFGNHAEAVVRPGELPRDVRARRANGGIEAFDDAMAAIDGVMHLTDGRPGAKVVVVFSDNHLVREDESDKCTMWLEKLKAANVAVVWIDDQLPIPYLPSWVEQVKVTAGPTLMLDAAKTIATAIERSLVAGRS